MCTPHVKKRFTVNLGNIQFRNEKNDISLVLMRVFIFSIDVYDQYDGESDFEGESDLEEELQQLDDENL